MKFHVELTPEHWFKYSFMVQLANVGMEVERTTQWKEANEPYNQKAFDRALELLYLTIADPKNKRRLKELCYVREALIDYFMFDNQYGSSDELWHDYFYPFAYAAALERGR